MSLAAFPHAGPPHRPRHIGGKPFSAAAKASPSLHAQADTQTKPLLESDFRGFPQIHSPSLQYKRYLFPLRNE
jgi:hypothetical protein